MDERNQIHHNKSSSTHNVEDHEKTNEKFVELGL